MRQNIGLIGKFGSGKDTAASVLVRTHGYVPLSFAAPLKEMVIEADPLLTHWTHNNVTVPLHLSDVLEKLTFEEAKREYPEVRRSLQRIGQGVRKLDPDYWVRLLLQDVGRFEYEQVPMVVTDVRYPNEADTLRKFGFTLVRITRQRAEGMTMDETRASLHDSETALDDYPADVTIRNDGDKIDLTKAILDVAA